jgi:hypothetical protein
MREYKRWKEMYDIDKERWYNSKLKEQSDLWDVEIRGLRLSIQQQNNALKAIHEIVANKLLNNKGELSHILLQFEAEINDILKLSESCRHIDR